MNQRPDMNSVTRHTIISSPRFFGALHSHENQLIAAAKRLQMKAAKSDLVFRMVESFNRNTVQATVTWHLHNQKGFTGASGRRA